MCDENVARLIREVIIGEKKNKEVFIKIYGLESSTKESSRGCFIEKPKSLFICPKKTQASPQAEKSHLFLPILVLLHQPKISNHVLILLRKCLYPHLPCMSRSFLSYQFFLQIMRIAKNQKVEDKKGRPCLHAFTRRSSSHMHETFKRQPH